MLQQLLKLPYKIGLKKPHQLVDRLRYLKRLDRKKHPLDIWYYSDRDLAQYDKEGDVVVRTVYRGEALFFYCSARFAIETEIIRWNLAGAQVLDLICDHAAEDSCVIDVGANIGAYSIPLAKVWPTCDIHAFEPNPAALRRFEHNRSLNGPLANLFVHNVGLSDKSDQLNLYAFDGVTGDSAKSTFVDPAHRNWDTQKVSVRVVPLDTLVTDFKKRISVIKIDVQGFEVNVLRGAQNLIAQHRPFIVFEHEDSNFQSQEVAYSIKRQLKACFDGLNYGVFAISRHDPSLLFPARWERRIHGDLLAIPLA